MNKKRRPPSALPGDAGMTVLELMIVLVILSLIGVVVTVQVVQQLDRAKVDVTKLQLKQIENSLELFRLDVRRYPNGDEGLIALVRNDNNLDGWRGPYLKNGDILNDPWGTKISYETTEGQRFKLGSFGSDKKEGGEGAQADLLLNGGG